jgi:hypothetical protein
MMVEQYRLLPQYVLAERRNWRQWFRRIIQLESDSLNIWSNELCRHMRGEEVQESVVANESCNEVRP